MNSLSIVISAYDQPELTVEHVKNSMRATVIPDEIIVVNDGGEDFIDKLKEIEKKTKLVYARIIEDIPWNTNGAYNLGLLISRGDLVSIEDCDHLCYPDFYEKAIEEISNGFDKVLGRYRQFMKMEELSKPQWTPYRSAGAHKLVGVYKREMLLKMKGFDERFGGYYGWNGMDLLRRLQKLECKTSAVSGFYMVIDGCSLQGKRPLTAGGKSKMEKENHHQILHNLKEGGQVEHPMLNFNYTVEYL